MTRRALEILLLPPASVVWLYALGWLLTWRWPRLGRGVRIGAVALLWFVATPLCGGALLGSLQGFPPLPVDAPVVGAQAIVVLSAEADRDGDEFGGAVAGPMTMQRLRYAAALHRRTGLPLLVSGGVPAFGKPPLAELMARAARDEFGVAVRWVEGGSADTWENARLSAQMLRPEGVQRVLLVTHAWHMPRAAACFAAQGLDVTAAPTGFRGPALQDWTSFLPHWTGLKDTCLGLHEWFGRAYYALTR